MMLVFEQLRLKKFQIAQNFILTMARWPSMHRPFLQMPAQVGRFYPGNQLIIGACYLLSLRELNLLWDNLWTSSSQCPQIIKHRLKVIKVQAYLQAYPESSLWHTSKVFGPSTLIQRNTCDTRSIKSLLNQLIETFIGL